MRILIVEDDNDIAELLKYNLEKSGNSIVIADNANNALISLEDIAFDMILLDIMLPGLTGIQFLNIIRGKEETKSIPVIITSAKNRDIDIVTALDKGADDYLTKPFSIELLNAKINSVSRRSVPFNSSSKLKVKNIVIDNDKHKVFVDDEEIKLTVKEYELLKLLLQHKNKVFTRNQLLNSVWSYDSDAMTRTVDAHIASLRKKLGSGGDIIKSIHKIGYGVEL